MSINHENKQLIFPEVVACMALFAAYAFDVGHHIPSESDERPGRSPPPPTVSESFLYV